MSKVNKRGADLLSTLEESMSEAGKKRKALAAADANAANNGAENATMRGVHNWLKGVFASGSVDATCAELELRLGKVRGGGAFNASVSASDYDALLAALAARGDEFVCERSESELFFYDAAQFGVGDGNVRVHWDPVAGAVVAVDRKKVLQRFDAELAHLPYDLRVAVAHEFPVPGLVPGATDLPPGAKTKRHRLRHSFAERGTADRPPLWRIDVTKVSATDVDDPAAAAAAANAAAAASTSLEVEIELLDGRHTLAHWIAGGGGDDEGGAALLAGLTQLWALLAALLGSLRSESSSSTSFGDVPLELVRDEFELEALRKTAVEWVPNFQNEGTFPGPMPVAFSRRYVALVQTNDYMVSEKSDGLRYMMLVNGSGVYLFDRNFDFYLVIGLDALIELYAKNEVTVLDGELVRNQKTKRPVYLIFDAVVIDGTPVGSKPLTERLKAVGEKVVAPYRAAVDDGRLNEAVMPFTMIGKAFQQKSQISTLLTQRIKRGEGGDRIFSDNRRYHKTDGLIFTPVNSAYRPTPKLPILKWKFLDKISADFKMRYDMRHTKWMLYCAGDRGTEIELRSLELSPEDTARLADDMKGMPLLLDGGIVVELSYDVWAGLWHYQTIRADKLQANNVRTVFDTLEVIAENVTEQELSYRVPRTPQDDRWQTRMTEAMTRVNQTASSGSSAASASSSQQPRRAAAPPPQQQQQQQQRAAPPPQDFNEL